MISINCQGNYRWVKRKGTIRMRERVEKREERREEEWSEIVR